MVRYCSKDHQVSDWPNHKRDCNAIKKYSALMDREEQKLRNHPAGEAFPPKVFEEHIGHFWGLLHTRPFMRARYALVEAILKVRTYDAALAALDHLMDCLGLCRGDNMGLRDLVPAQMLRLDRKQECYDFVKWYATTGQKSDYNWSDMDLPFLDVKDADVLEAPPKYLCGKYLALSHAVAFILLKIKLLLAVRAGSEGWDILKTSQTFKQIDDKVSQDGTEDLEKVAVEVIKILKSHVHTLYSAIGQANTHFWGALIDPGSRLDERPDCYAMGSEEETVLVLKYSYDAWKESPGAVEVIKAIFQKKDY